MNATEALDRIQNFNDPGVPQPAWANEVKRVRKENGDDKALEIIERCIDVCVLDLIAGKMKTKIQDLSPETQKGLFTRLNGILNEETQKAATQ